MHPILGSRARMGTYLLGWVPVAVMFGVQAAVRPTPLPAAIAMGVVSAFAAAVLFLSSFFLCRALPVGSTHPGTLLGTWCMASVIMGALWTAVTYGILRTLGHFYAPLSPWGEFTLPNFVLTSMVGCILYLVTVALHYLLIALEQRREAELTKQELRVLAREAELKALRAQLNPHFLFNSLNSISALTSLDPKRAREMCVLLSDFLRKSLRLGAQPEVKLAEELDLLKNYLAIEQIRFGERLKVEWEVQPGLEEIPVPTLLLQPLVENAIKHGISQVMEGGTISINASRTGPWLQLRIENPIDPDLESPKGLGLGQRAVRQRLEGRYGDQTRFEVGTQGDRHTSSLTLPIPENTP